MVIFAHNAPWLLPISRRQIEEIIRRLALHFAPNGLDVHLVDDATIAKLNAEFMGCPGPTNILTFPGDSDTPGALVISIDSFARECLLYAQSPETHFLRLLSHGFGHLGGLDHGPQMAQREAECLTMAKALL